MLDLSPMRSVRIDPSSRTARVEPGVTLGEFDKEAQAFGLATPLGINSTTGVAGLTLGGGFGWLSSKHGLTVRKLDPAATGNEARKAAEERAIRDREEKQRAFEQRRRDMALVNTYTSAREIEEHRQRTLQVPIQTLKGLEPRLKKAQEMVSEEMGKVTGGLGLPGMGGGIPGLF